MTIAKYVGMDVHKESISIAVMNSTGKFVMECVIETKASMLLQFIDGLRGDVRVTFEEGTWAAWLGYHDVYAVNAGEIHARDTLQFTAEIEARGILGCWLLCLGLLLGCLDRVGVSEAG